MRFYMDYDFKRDVYYELSNKLLGPSNVFFLLGPRKSGKTVCMKQIDSHKPNSVYINFKEIGEWERSKAVFDKVISSIKDNDDIVFLLDEITYASEPAVEIERVANSLSTYNSRKTKIVFSGSQSVALESWANTSFAGNAEKIRLGFLSYAEYLSFRNTTEVSADTYQDFLYHVHEFYNFNSLEEYLRGCIDETIYSNSNTSRVIFNNKTNLIENNVDVLLDVCYQTLFTLHNHVNDQTFGKDNKLFSNIRSSFYGILSDIDDDCIRSRISNSFISKYESYSTTDLATLKQALTFLCKCDLITITPVYRSLDNLSSIYTDLMSDDSKIDYKADLFEKYNICIKYPMFYIRILEDVLGDSMPKSLPTALLGSVVECHARGLLPEGIEYHDFEDNEIDYIRIRDNIAVEFSVSNKRNRQLCFDLLPANVECVLMTKDIERQEGNISRKPFYKYVYELSLSKNSSLADKGPGGNGVIEVEHNYTKASFDGKKMTIVISSGETFVESVNPSLSIKSKDDLKMYIDGWLNKHIK